MRCWVRNHSLISTLSEKNALRAKGACPEGGGKSHHAHQSLQVQRCDKIGSSRHRYHAGKASLVVMMLVCHCMPQGEACEVGEAPVTDF